MGSKLTVKPEFVVNLQGSDFVTYEGLLDLAHQAGLQSLTVEILQFPSKENGYMAICEAIASTEDDKVFVDIGDAAPNSVNSMVTPHLVRMASTRAKARVLRDLTNVGITALEEVDTETMKSGAPAPSMDMNSLLMEARELQQKCVQQGKQQELVQITDGKSLVAIKDPDLLKEAIEKVRKVVG